MTDDLLKEVSAFGTLEEALKWGLARQPRADLIDVIVQDEYTHDVILRISSEIYLAFDTN